MKVDVEVVRAVLWDGAVRKVGEVISVEHREARELISSGKVVPHQAEEIASESGPMTTESASAIVAGRPARKRKQDDEQLQS